MEYPFGNWNSIKPKILTVDELEKKGPSVLCQLFWLSDFSDLKFRGTMQNVGENVGAFQSDLMKSIWK